VFLYVAGICGYQHNQISGRNHSTYPADMRDHERLYSGQTIRLLPFLTPRYFCLSSMRVQTLWRVYISAGSLCDSDVLSDIKASRLQYSLFFSQQPAAEDLMYVFPHLASSLLQDIFSTIRYSCCQPRLRFQHR